MPRLTAAYISIPMLFLALAAGFPAPAAAAPAAAAPAAAAPDRQEIAAALETRQAAQASLAEKSRALEEETTALQRKLVEGSRNLRRLEESLTDSKTRLEALRKKKSKLEARLFAEQDAVGGLVTAAQRFNRTSAPTMMVQSEPLAAARAAMILKSLIPALHETSAELRAEIAALGQVEQDIAAQQRKRQEALAAIRKEETQLATLLDSRRKALRQTDAEKKAHQAEIARLTREAKNLDELVEHIQMPRAKPAAARQAGQRMAGGKRPEDSAAAPTGTVQSPVPGTVQTAFGDIDGLGAKSQGITYHARGNARVVTPMAGTVRFAGPFHKYKQLLIVEHAGGYHSLIAGLGHIDTAVGARLAAGEPVGRVEGAGAGEVPVYYELRRNGTPVNPQKILVAQHKQNKS